MTGKPPNERQGQGACFFWLEPAFFRLPTGVACCKFGSHRSGHPGKRNSQCSMGALVFPVQL